MKYPMDGKEAFDVYEIALTQGGADLPGRTAVRPVPNCVLLSSGHPISASALSKYK